MQNANTRRPDEASPDADATSKETLADLEESEKDSVSESKDESEVPAPDGVKDESRNPDGTEPM